MTAQYRICTVLLLLAAPVAGQHVHGAEPVVADSALTRQLDAVRKATERYRDHRNAVADGYKLFGADGPLMGEHWYRPDLVKRTELDLEHPATLQYVTINGKRELIGVAFGVYQRPGEPLPAGFAGEQDHWHVHDITKLARAAVTDPPLLRRAVERRIADGKLGAGDNRSQLVMVHAWVWSDNPDGMFAQQDRVLPYLRAGLPADWSKSASLDAAWGVSLLRGGCAHELLRLDRLARLAPDQKQKLNASCADAETQVRQAAADTNNGAALNRAAEVAWRAFADVRDRTLTAEQKARLGSVMEPMMGH